ncbi:methylated-DNA--[protein]-cysteine S-methyltransferase [Miniphocaeibacter halophilus]|uniref:Methylated-DNA--[protein]-cysteine S-methyltransferase n=1 Tax=Miniphocaeibacter halophilus TaxID=2931922 RepID=A0AC61N0N9_9FIRM|nr:methylated-DNA--[protein]-cysteine S-methyltransferase [Miniphocaeibacter halophilus]QQK08851.1 methylated-DNA--[protein]-cysteine S-methyltransferase [Miniphocaeibacter halophilus]
MKKYYRYNTDLCDLYIAEENSRITNISFTKKFEGQLLETELTKEAFKQIEEYLQGKRKEFDLPLKTKGTDFQNRVWNSLKKIPYGKTCSYEDIAKDIGNEKACRAVGNANNKNPIVIVIPCHRVIGKNRKLVGYGGGLSIKKRLLELEEKYSENKGTK